MWPSGVSPCGQCPTIDAPDSGFRGPGRTRLEQGPAQRREEPVALPAPSLRAAFRLLLASLLEPGASQ